MRPLSFALLALVVGCQEYVPPGKALTPAEKEARAAFALSTLSVRGRFVDAAGAPVAGATVKLQEQSTTTGADGSFAIPGLRRMNALLEVTAPGFRREVIPVELRRPVSEGEVALEPEPLVRDEPSRTRFLFTGDFSMGRRFLDPTDETQRGEMPPDSLDALIQVSNPAQGSVKAVSFVKPVFDAADFPVVNLETVVTDRPETPHKTKPYVFFTLPGSLPALKELGVSYVGLGNNHVYDYLEGGLSDTLANLDAAGFHHSGAGADPSSAFAPWRQQLGDRSYSFVSACSVAGDEYAVNFVAGDTKGGAADLRDTERMKATVAAEKAQASTPIAIFHGGFEYSDRPSANVVKNLELAAEAGAALGIGHHPHTPQGFGRHNGTLLAYSLGNFVIDQDRMETMLGLLAEIDFRSGAVEQARTLPIYLEDYRPRLVAGQLGENLLRWVSELSKEHGVQLVSRNGRGVVLPEGVSAVSRERTVTLEVDVPERGWAVADVRSLLGAHESIAAVRFAGAGGELTAGRDLLRYGDFEDHDVDGDEGEAARWDLSDDSVFGCLSSPRRGTSALCMVKSATRSPAKAILLNRVRAPQDGEEPPNKQLTVVGWAKGVGAGRFEVTARYFASEGDKEFGDQDLLLLDGGDYDWSMFSEDLAFPAEPASPSEFNAPRAVRLTLAHRLPKKADGLLAVDDLAIVAWDARHRGAGLDLATPNLDDFFRVEAPAGHYTLSVTARADTAP